ncbi:MAG: hypothetical protein JW755_07205 [Candidatus Aminicenantes bacterium]|nr:hypothetical protein [Candidatus Aminicenantes bacterium]
MQKIAVSLLTFLLIMPVSILLSQEAEETISPVFLRITIYPTLSLSRYDYNNDLDLYEIRVYIELRKESQSGPPIQNAQITALSQILDFINNHYEKRIKVDGEQPPDEIEISIRTEHGFELKEKILIPMWLTLKEPQPQIMEGNFDLNASWEFSKFNMPVNFHAYNFKSGDIIWSEDHTDKTRITIPAEKLPKGSILRIYVISSWFLKHYLRGNDRARGSEINIIPWSQVFLRTK